MFGVLVRTTMLLAVAPPVPVSWWPGGRILPDSVLHRLPGVRARRAAADKIMVLQPSATRVIAIPVDGDRRRRAVGRGTIAAPWGEPVVPFAGVTVSTSLVPRSWLRPLTRAQAVPVVTSAAVATSPPAPAPVSPVRPRAAMHGRMDPPAVHVRLRRAATLALGMLVSLVAMEAAARTSRR